MKKTTIALSSVALPLVAFGQSGISGTVADLGSVISSLIPIAFSAALLFFFYGLAMFILKSGKEQDSGKQIMIWGVLALFVMTSIMGIIQFLGDSIGISTDENEFEVPTVGGDD